MSYARALANLALGGFSTPTVDNLALAATMRGWQRKTLAKNPYPADFVESSDDLFERDVLSAIAKAGHRLKLRKTTGVVTSAIRQSTEFRRHIITIYRLESPELAASLEFELVRRLDGKAGQCVHVLLLLIAPAKQGSFFRCRQFIEEVRSVLLEGLEMHSLHSMFGEAVVNDFPIRQRREWRDKPTKDKQTHKLMRLYQRCGAMPTPNRPGYVSFYSKRALAELKCSPAPQTQALLAQAELLERKPRIKMPPRQPEEMSFST